MPNIGPVELAIVLLIAVLFFGPKRLPDLGRSLGHGVRGFKESISGKDDAGEEPAPLMEARSPEVLSGGEASRSSP